MRKAIAYIWDCSNADRAIIILAIVAWMFSTAAIILWK